MKCPKCGNKTGVDDTRPYHQIVERRRVCKKCGHSFITFEKPATNTQEVAAKR